MEAGKFWLSADWGTSNFRLRLIDGASLRVLAEISGPPGIASFFQTWKEQVSTSQQVESEANRFAFYQRFLLEQIGRLETGSVPENTPVILSGMASSTIGMKVLPYQLMPCPADGSGLTVFTSAATASFPFPLALVSGVRNADDVMRGEETMLIGAVAANDDTTQSGCCIFPGTHSKHIQVSRGQVVNLRTYMTGELFALLSEKSILAASVEIAGPLSEPAAFNEGVAEGWSGRLLHSLFMVRTADLLGKSGHRANYCFLSGLLIGHELRELEGKDKLSLVGSGALTQAYQAALCQLFPGIDLKIIDAGTALIRGQWKIADKIF